MSFFKCSFIASTVMCLMLIQLINVQTETKHFKILYSFSMNCTFILVFFPYPPPLICFCLFIFLNKQIKRDE